MRSQIILFAVVFSSIALSGCGGGTTPANSTIANTNVVNANTSNPLETTKKAPEETANNAPTLMPVFKAYCDAKIKKDEAALRRIYSQDTIKFFESQMKVDKEKSLLKYLDVDKVSDKLCEARNEQITGDTAIAEIRTETYPNGIKVVFVKENGEWKLTNRSPAIDSMKQGAANSNSPK